MPGLHERICIVDGCPEPHRSKGFCNAHYQRHLKGMAMDAQRLISTDGPCLVNGCDLPRRSRGLCRSHYEKAIRRADCPVCGGVMQKKSALCATCFRAAMAAQLPTEKLCGGCEVMLPVSAFDLRKSEGVARWRSNCRECQCAEQRLRARFRAKTAQPRDRSGERASAPYLGLRRYAKKLGIPWADIVERYPADNRCEICRRTPQEANPGGRFVRLALDHCHETGALRGFLCGLCNTGLGHLGDTPERLREAHRYLSKRHPKRASSSGRPSRPEWLQEELFAA